MKKKNIIRNNKDFKKIIEGRKVYKNNFFSIYVASNNYKRYRIGISVPKKLGKAHLRNKLKRQLKFIFDCKKDLLKDLDYVVICDRKILQLNFLEIKNYLISLIYRIKEDLNEKI